VAPSKNTEREARLARERLRRFNARQAVYAHQVKRRRRDNIVAVIGLVVIAALATATQVSYFSVGPGVPEATATPSATPTSASGSNVGDVPSADVAEGRTWTGTLTINDVPLAVSLYGAAAPQAVASVVTDVNNGYYNGSTCHRLVNTESLKTLQCGSIDGTGAADPSYSFGPVENAPEDGVYPAGTIALARAATEYSQDHQFFVILADSTIDPSTGGYTVVGSVTDGLAALQSAVADAGIADGATDGAPVVTTTISGFTIQ
jgi:peptidyl-prolyl cis-trans isomerase B (cyclophilin B)